jgi:hypothetical protein
VPGRGIYQTRITPLCQETQASLKPSVACRPEFHLKAKRRGAFRHPEACPCHPLRILTLASMAVRCAGSAAFIISAVPPVAVAVSAEAIVSVAAEATAIGKGAQVSNALARFRKWALPARSLQSRRLPASI